MSARWKWIGTIAAVIFVISGVLLCGVVWMLQETQNAARELYGRPLPAQIMPLVGMPLSGNSRMGMYMDTPSQTLLALIQAPATAKTQPHTFSDKAALDVLHRFPAHAEIAPLLRGVDKGTPITLPVGNETIYGLLYSDIPGKTSVMGTLNLQNGPLVFIAFNAEGNGPVNLLTVKNILNRVPTILNDPHLHSASIPPKRN